jgi:L-lactate dehydrogenase complex protein LldE
MTGAVSLFIPCVVDMFHPQVGLDTARVLERAGAKVLYPKDQTCCGQMQFKEGLRREARRMASHFLEVFDGAKAVVAPSGSCVATVRHYYPLLFEEGSSLKKRALEMGRKTFELSEFLIKVLNVQDLGARWPGRAVYHASCQVTRGIGVRKEPLTLLSCVEGLELVDMEGADRCCGFGGAFSLEYPDISERMVREKAEAIVKSGADYVISAEASCLMNIAGYLSRHGMAVEPVHLAQVLAGQRRGE